MVTRTAMENIDSITLTRRSTMTVDGTSFGDVLVSRQGCGMLAASRDRLLSDDSNTSDGSTKSGTCCSRKGVESHGNDLFINIANDNCGNQGEEVEAVNSVFQADLSEFECLVGAERDSLELAHERSIEGMTKRGGKRNTSVVKGQMMMKGHMMKVDDTTVTADPSMSNTTEEDNLDSLLAVNHGMNDNNKGCPVTVRPIAQQRNLSITEIGAERDSLSLSRERLADSSTMSRRGGKRATNEVVDDDDDEDYYCLTPAFDDDAISVTDSISQAAAALDFSLAGERDSINAAGRAKGAIAGTATPRRRVLQPVDLQRVSLTSTTEIENEDEASSSSRGCDDGDDPAAFLEMLAATTAAKRDVSVSDIIGAERDSLRVSRQRLADCTTASRRGGKRDTNEAHNGPGAAEDDDDDDCLIPAFDDDDAFSVTDSISQAAAALDFSLAGERDSIGAAARGKGAVDGTTPSPRRRVKQPVNLQRVSLTSTAEVANEDESSSRTVDDPAIAA